MEIKGETLTSTEEQWEHEITAETSFFDFKIKEIWNYKDLLYLLVKRDFIAAYKQTILGPLWFFIHPILTSLLFFVVFGKIAGIQTDGIPPILFYMAGISCWNYFATCLISTSNTFSSFKRLYGKVYFPRLIGPLSVIISGLMKFGIQLLLFFFVYIYYFFQSGHIVNPNFCIFLLPLLIFLLGGIGLGLGLILSSLTSKYRDLNFVIQYGTQALMYATPIVYPLSEIPEQYQFLSLLNPLTSVMETFKYGFLGQGIFSWIFLGYSFIFTIIVLFLGIGVFNITEKNVMDTV